MGPRLSPDGSRLAVGARVSAATRCKSGYGIWTRGTFTRLTLEGGGLVAGLVT